LGGRDGAIDGRPWRLLRRQLALSIQRVAFMGRSRAMKSSSSRASWAAEGRAASPGRAASNRLRCSFCGRDGWVPDATRRNAKRQALVGYPRWDDLGTRQHGQSSAVTARGWRGHGAHMAEYAGQIEETTTVGWLLVVVVAGARREVRGVPRRVVCAS